MKQQTLAMASGFERYGKKTRRALFLEEMEQVVPWAELCALIEPTVRQGGQRPSAGGNRADVADVFFAAVVQPVAGW
jgi:IS5 family transposase